MSEDIYCKIYFLDEEKEKLKDENEFKKLYNKIFNSQERNFKILSEFKEYEESLINSSIGDLLIPSYEEFIKNKYNILFAYNSKTDDFCGACIFYVYDCYIYITTLYTFNINIKGGINEKYKGVGTNIINSLKSLLTENHYGIILTPLENAIEFYKKQGFINTNNNYYYNLDNYLIYYNKKFNNKITKNVLESNLEYDNGKYLLELINKKENTGFDYKMMYEYTDYQNTFVLLFLEKLEFDNEIITHISYWFRLNRSYITGDNKKTFHQRCINMYNYVKNKIRIEDNINFLESVLNLDKEDRNVKLECLIINEIIKLNVKPKIFIEHIKDISDECVPNIVKYLENNDNLLYRKLALLLKSKKRKIDTLEEADERKKIKKDGRRKNKIILKRKKKKF